MRSREIHREEYEVALQNLTSAMAFGCKRNSARAQKYADTIHGYVLQKEAAEVHAKSILEGRWKERFEKIAATTEEK